MPRREKLARALNTDLVTQTHLKKVHGTYAMNNHNSSHAIKSGHGGEGDGAPSDREPVTNPSDDAHDAARLLRAPLPSQLRQGECRGDRLQRCRLRASVSVSWMRGA